MVSLQSEMYCVLKHMNRVLIRWAQRKYKDLQTQQRASLWLGKIARFNPKLFVHWQMGIFSWTG